MNSSLLRGLLRIGAAQHRVARAHSGRLASMIIAMGCMLLCFGLSAVMFNQFTAELRSERSAAIAPIFVDSEDEASLLYLFGYGAIGEMPVTIAVIEPLSEDAPLPPGLSSWPEPGTSIVSPTLAEELAGDSAAMYGTVAGIIGAEGLETPSERRVYIRPSVQALDPDSMLFASGFGDDSEYALHGTGYLYAAYPFQTLTILFFLLIVPGVFVIWLGSSMGAEARQKNATLLLTSGLQRKHLIVADLRDLGPAAVVGILPLLLLIAVASLRDIRIDPLDAIYLAQDTRSIAPLLILTILGGLLLSLLLISTSRTMTRRLKPRRRERHILSLSLWSSLCLFGLVFAVCVPLSIPLSPNKTLAAWAGLALTGATCWAPITAVLQWAGRLLASRGLYTGKAHSLTAGRILQNISTGTRLTTLGICLTVLIAGQAQLQANTASGQYVDAVNQFNVYGTSVLRVSHAGNSDLSSLISALPEETGAILVGYAEWDDSTQLNTASVTASCDVLTALSITCPGEGNTSEEAVTTLYQSFVTSADRVLVTQQEVTATAPEHELLLLSLNGSQLDLVSMQTLASALTPGATVSAHSSWLVSGADAKLDAAWVITFATIGILCLFITFAALLSAATQRTTRLLAPLGSFTGQPKLASSTAALSTALPILVAGVIGCLLYWLLPQGMTRSYGPNSVIWQPSGAFVLSALVATTLAAVLGALWASRSARTAVAVWRPGQVEAPTI